jgi:hypothetical protein
MPTIRRNPCTPLRDERSPRGPTRRAAATLALAAAAAPAFAALPRAAPPPVPLPARSRRFGINLAGLAYYASQFPFADLTTNSEGWERKTDPGGDAAPWPAAPEGHPLALGRGQHAEMAVGWPGSGYAPGRYVVLWDGDGELAFPGRRHTVVERARGRAVLAVPDAEGELRVRIDRTDPADPVRRVRVLWPGTEATHAAQPFNPLFLARTAPFSILRFMDWGATNGSPVAEWGERTLPSRAGWAGRGGVPVERMLDLCNALRADPWLCVPHRASDAHARALGALVAQRLDPARTAYVEYSNEVWNLGFEQARWAVAESARRGLAVPNGQPALAYAARATEVFRAFDAGFGARARDRTVRVLAGQAVWTSFSEAALAHRDTARQVDALAVAPYFHAGWTEDPARAAEAARLAPEALHALMRERIRGDVRRAVERNAALAAKHGLRLLAYEAGSHDTAAGAAAPLQAPLTETFRRAHRHPGMEAVYAEYLDLWVAGGGDALLQYFDIGRWSPWGLWGLLETVTEDPALSPKHRAVLAAIARHR